MHQLMDEEKFLEKYSINEKEFKDTGIAWGDLESIFNDYTSCRGLLENTGRTIAEILREHPDAHTVRMRIKDPEHLIEKLIRKKINNYGFSFSIDDYKTKITDLIGLRVLHLYKNQAINLDKMIRNYWELEETVTIYIRQGDIEDDEKAQLEADKKFNVKKHSAGYRSWHYLIKSRLTKELTLAEIQVRTIFEEGWSEIDHQLRYPYYVGDQILTNQLLVLNRLAGSADEMVNSIKETLQRFDKLNKEKQELNNMIEELRKEISNLNLKEPESKSLLSVVKNFEKNHLIKSSTVIAPYLDRSDFSISNSIISGNVGISPISNGIFGNSSKQ
ncbi:hypothetical protein [Bacillus altitudinis]|uniref:hypothetical protein n=1 Tax=Bacillus altitudinis TaxID=293387 RepID=UPI00227DDC87|nr:hypothetical protein [Bacillus altitudinis]MCY7437605.1 hypothetical protein [Bacillus altitudinis]MEC0967409.1 hypothetical protein [Bacillus altitudinis]MEC1001335.1 hypothetical protein [Bacillus altitudinis]MEC1142131.1 hypothetical protein [Bacillus altitudinis]